MPDKRLPRPRDPAQLAKLMIDIASGEVEDKALEGPDKDPAAVKRGRLGGLKGGLASATVVVCTVLAAIVGVVGATEVTMGMIALPAMLKRGYNAELACGALLAGGTLGILIPPSVMAIVYSVVAQQSLGELLAGAVFPGLLLSGLYILYISVRCLFDPALGPPLPLEERVSLRQKLSLLRNVVAPILLIALALGVIFFGIATPVEAAGIGTFGALIVCAIHRRLTWQTLPFL